MAPLTLVIANRNYSSWSFRPWLHLRLGRVPFDVIRLPMDTPEWDLRIRQFSPNGRLPVLLDGEVRVWDSLAIMLHAISRFPSCPRWPDEPSARAEALSLSAEMHSGFPALRQEMPFNCRARVKSWTLSEAAREDVTRVMEIWESCRHRHAHTGDFLFGPLTTADISFAPVVLRFETYGIPMNPACSDYATAVRALPEVQEWLAEARVETETMPGYDPPGSW